MQQHCAVESRKLAWSSHEGRMQPTMRAEPHAQSSATAHHCRKSRLGQQAAPTVPASPAARPPLLPPTPRRPGMAAADVDNGGTGSSSCVPFVRAGNGGGADGVRRPPRLPAAANRGGWVHPPRAIRREGELAVPTVAAAVEQRRRGPRQQERNILLLPGERRRPPRRRRHGRPHCCCCCCLH